MERKQFKIESKAINKDKGTGAAAIAQLNVIDHDGDVILPGAFGEQEVNLLPAHDFHAPRLGKGSVKEDGGFAIADFKFNLDDDAITSKEWFSALKFDMENGTPLQEWSFGFKIIESDFGQFQGQEVRFLKSLQVYEISPVIRGAGIGTGTLSLKDKKNMTFKEEMEHALAQLTDVKALIDRAKSLTELRLSQNKPPMIEDNKKALQPFLSLLTEVYNDCKNLDAAILEEIKSVDNLFADFQRIIFEQKHLQE